MQSQQLASGGTQRHRELALPVGEQEWQNRRSINASRVPTMPSEGDLFRARVKHPPGIPGNSWVGYVLCKGPGASVIHVRAGDGETLVINVNVISFASLGWCGLGKFHFYCV